MNNTDHFLIAVAACVAVTAAAVLLLRASMRSVLAELCGSHGRGDFWVTLASLCMLLAATAASTVPDTLLRRPAPDAPAVLQSVVLQYACGLAGVLVSLGVLTGAIVASIQAFVRGHHGRREPTDDNITRLLRRKREFWGEGEPR